MLSALGPRCPLNAELGSPAQLFNNALINYCKLQRAQLTIIERSTEAACSQTCILITELSNTCFWIVALQHGCVFRQETFSLSEKFVFGEESEAHHCLMNHTLMLALVADRVRAKGVQMKAVNEMSMHLDLRRDSEGEERGCLRWI